jgi:hypothetical protein
MATPEGRTTMIDAHAASSRFLLGSGDHPIPVVVRPIGAPIDEVWRAWTEPDGLVRWLGAAESPVTGVGVPVPLNMMATQMASDLGSRAVLTPQVVEPPAEGKERLQFTFEDTADPGGTVLVLLRHNGESTDLVWSTHCSRTRRRCTRQRVSSLAGPRSSTC